MLSWSLPPCPPSPSRRSWPLSRRAARKRPTASDCQKLAGVYAKGEGVPKDLGKAAGFYKKACDANNALGCLDLAAMHRSGEGASKDVQKAALLLKRGCDLGNADGCTQLGLMYFEGKELPKDLTQAGAAC